MYRPATLTALVKLFTEFQSLKSAQSTEAEDPDEVLRSLDFEDAAAGGGGAGYQAAYSKLAASEAPAEDPVANVIDTRDFVGKALSSKIKGDPTGGVRQLVVSADPGAVRPFVQALETAGYSF
jgi:exportin-2 (importin alpha re-exporter)